MTKPPRPNGAARGPERRAVAHIIVVGNEKGGAGKSTVAMHVATALSRMGHKVGTLDLDLRQKTLGRYISNRRAFMAKEGLSLPTDLWVPSTERIRPQQSTQYAAGWARTYGDWEVSLEGYYKDMDGLLSYKEGASFVFGLESDWQDQVVQGEGRSYGLEVFVQRKVGDTKGWIGYTLSKTERRFDDLNSGRWFPFTYDRRHDVSLVVTHTFDEAWTGSVAWVFGTGRALTLPESVYTTFLPSTTWPLILEVEVPSERNAYRMSPYHRLDVAMTRTLVGDKGSRQLVLSIYNAYNNLNPFFAQTAVQDDGTPVIREYGIFPIIPSISWRVTF